LYTLQFPQVILRHVSWFALVVIVKISPPAPSLASLGFPLELLGGMHNHTIATYTHFPPRLTADHDSIPGRSGNRPLILECLALNSRPISANPTRSSAVAASHCSSLSSAACRAL